MSEGSDDGASRRAKGVKSLKAAASLQSRMASCPKGHLPNSWNVGDCTSWRIRSVPRFTIFTRFQAHKQLLMWLGDLLSRSTEAALLQQHAGAATLRGLP